MATAAQRWANRTRLVRARQIQLIYNNGDLVIATEDMPERGIRKGAIGRVVNHVFPLGSSYSVEFEDHETDWNANRDFGHKNTASIPVERIQPR